MDDVKLAQKYQQWDTEIFTEIYEKYVDGIYKFIYLKVYDKHLAEDICQDVFIKALDKLSDFKIDSKGTLKSWLYTIAYHKVVDTYRKKKDTVDIEAVLNTWKDTDIHKLIDDKDKLKEVIAYIKKLKPEHRDVIFMRVWEWLSYKEISEITGMSTDNCKKIFSRTCKKLNEHFILFIFLLILI